MFIFKTKFNLSSSILCSLIHWIGLFTAVATMSFCTSGRGFKSPYILGHLAFLASFSARLASRCSAIACLCLFWSSSSLLSWCWVFDKFWTAHWYSSEFRFFWDCLASTICWSLWATISSIYSFLSPLKWYGTNRWGASWDLVVVKFSCMISLMLVLSISAAFCAY